MEREDFSSYLATRRNFAVQLRWGRLHIAVAIALIFGSCILLREYWWWIGTIGLVVSIGYLLLALRLQRWLKNAICNMDQQRYQFGPADVANL